MLYCPLLALLAGFGHHIAAGWEMELLQSGVYISGKAGAVK
jgi:hypothetical protein